MSKARLETRIGTVLLKNPVIAGSAEHLIDAEGVRRAIKAGAGAVVVKSTNESRPPACSYNRPSMRFLMKTGSVLHGMNQHREMHLSHAVLV